MKFQKVCETGGKNTRYKMENKIYIDKWINNKVTKIRIIKVIKKDPPHLHYELIWSNFGDVDDPEYNFMLIGGAAYNNLRELTDEEKVEYL